MSNVLEAAWRAAELISCADGLLITAGAGMGVDSGLPDFRGHEGFWQAYPALGRRGLHFADVASPQTFEHDPQLAWGFYGHRLNLYRDTVPHKGFATLLSIAQQMEMPAFVITSNVDGHFQKGGFSARRIWEIHGSIHHLQCLNGCMRRVWPADDFRPEIDDGACSLTSEVPRCPSCGEAARPNILMFSDGQWIDHRSRTQEKAFRDWLESVERPVTVELGAGTAIASIRRMGERMSAPLIRVNPREPSARQGDVSLACGAAEAIMEIEACLAQRGIACS